jgi:hypothetical protein
MFLLWLAAIVADYYGAPDLQLLCITTRFSSWCPLGSIARKQVLVYFWGQGVGEGGVGGWLYTVLRIRSS